MGEIRLSTPVSENRARQLRIHDSVYLSGLVYTARDLAHRRMVTYIRKGMRLPFKLEGSTIFHAGPIVKKNQAGWELTAVGPTTSMRMEPYEHEAIKHGARLIIGKGGMGKKTTDALADWGGAYLVAAPGCALVHAKAVQEVVDVHWDDLGMMEAVWVLKIKDWGPLVTAIDSEHGDLYRKISEEGKRRLPEIFKGL